MEKNNLLRELNENEMMDIVGGGYWMMEVVNGTRLIYWVEE